MSFYKPIPAFITLVFLLTGAFSAFGQTVGSTEQSIVSQYGEPQMERSNGGRKTWIYANGTRLIIANGVVVESNVSATQPPPQRIEEKVAPLPASTPAPPKPQLQSKSTPASTAPAHPTTAKARREKIKLSGLGVALVTPGLLVGLVASVWFIIATFRQSILWGIACLLIPFASVIFTIVHWRASKVPFLLFLLVSTPLIFLGILFGSA